MQRIQALVKTMLMLVVPFAVAFGMPREARAQVDVDVVVSPPAAYVATTEPEYFDGRPVYYYNNYWYYRDHGRWSYYQTEPDYLRGRREHWGWGGAYGRAGWHDGQHGGYGGGYARGGGGYVRGGGGYRGGGGGYAHGGGGYVHGGGGYAHGDGGSARNGSSGPARYHYRR